MYVGLDVFCGDGSVGGTVGSMPMPAAWLAACWAATVTWQACRYLIDLSGKRLVYNISRFK